MERIRLDELESEKYFGLKLILLQVETNTCLVSLLVNDFKLLITNFHISAELMCAACGADVAAIQMPVKYTLMVVVCGFKLQVFVVTLKVDGQQDLRTIARINDGQWGICVLCSASLISWRQWLVGRAFFSIEIAGHGIERKPSGVPQFMLRTSQKCPFSLFV